MQRGTITFDSTILNLNLWMGLCLGVSVGCILRVAQNSTMNGFGYLEVLRRFGRLGIFPMST